MTHEAHIEEQLAEILAEVRALSSAFPLDAQGQADVSGHRQFHEAKIAAAEAEQYFWRELRLELAKKGVLAILTVLIGLMVAMAGFLSSCRGC